MDLTIPALLIVLVTPSGHGTATLKEKHPFPTFEMCMKAVDNAKLELPGTDDQEGAAAMYCVPKEEEWWKR